LRNFKKSWLIKQKTQLKPQSQEVLLDSLLVLEHKIKRKVQHQNPKDNFSRKAFQAILAQNLMNPIH
jgi:hypothetical protein